MGEGVCDLEVLSVRLRGAGGLVNGVRLVWGAQRVTVLVLCVGCWVVVGRVIAHARERQ